MKATLKMLDTSFKQDFIKLGTELMQNNYILRF